MECQLPPSRQTNMAIRISFGTYKLFYEARSEDFLWRKWESEEGEKLKERARAREDERRKCGLLT
jgi:paired amphipathic helix protein Sin3a